MPLDLTPLSESSETLVALPEDGFTEAYTNPALYPSADTFPSPDTFPSIGLFVARVGLWLEDNSPDTQNLTPLTED